MTRDLDVLSVGEALVDLLPDRRGQLRDCSTFVVHSGGAPANVAVGCARLGLRTAFCGVVGDDEFGRLLEKRLASEQIELQLRFSREARTGLWFVALDEHGERTFFAPTGQESADKLFDPRDVLRAPLGRARLVHCGSSAHIRPASQAALRELVQAARAAGARVSFDPNVREHLWHDLADLHELCAAVLPWCDLVKLSEDETELCVGERDPERAAAKLCELGVTLACITLGARGVLARRGAEVFRVPAPEVEVVDTTGAGDGFVAGLLSRDPLSLSGSQLEGALRFACAVGSRVCTQPGAVAGLPRKGEVAEPG